MMTTSHNDLKGSQAPVPQHLEVGAAVLPPPAGVGDAGLWYHLLDGSPFQR